MNLWRRYYIELLVQGEAAVGAQECVKPPVNAPRETMVCAQKHGVGLAGKAPKICLLDCWGHENIRT